MIKDISNKKPYIKLYLYIKYFFISSISGILKIDKI